MKSAPVSPALIGTQIDPLCVLETARRQSESGARNGGYGAPAQGLRRFPDQQAGVEALGLVIGEVVERARRAAR